MQVGPVQPQVIRVQFPQKETQHEAVHAVHPVQAEHAVQFVHIVQLLQFVQLVQAVQFVQLVQLLQSPQSGSVGSVSNPQSPPRSLLPAPSPGPPPGGRTRIIRSLILKLVIVLLLWWIAFAARALLSAPRFTRRQNGPELDIGVPSLSGSWDSFPARTVARCESARRGLCHERRSAHGGRVRYEDVADSTSRWF